jgi:hypothetical protein
MHSDGSRTVYKFDNAQHKAVATTTDPDGKLRETIRYELDDAGRFSSGEISGADGRLRFKSRYKYDDAGNLWKRLKAPKTARFCIRLFTVTTRRASRPGILCSTHPANW